MGHQGWTGHPRVAPWAWGLPRAETTTRLSSTRAVSRMKDSIRYNAAVKDNVNDVISKNLTYSC